MTTSRLALLSLALALALAAPLHALAPVLLGDDAGQYPVTQMGMLVDPTGNLTIEDVSSDALGARFVPTLLRSGRHAWTRITVTNGSRTRRDWILVTQMRTFEATLYTPSETGDGWIAQRGGDIVPPVAEAPVRYRWPAHRLHLESGQTLTGYLYTRSGGDNTVVMLMDVWPAAEFSRFQTGERLLLGTYYGVVAVMVLYNLFVFLSLRDPVYLYYVLAAASMGLFFLSYNGIGREYLWANADYERQWALIAGFASIPMLAFVRQFLQTRVHARRIDLMLHGLAALQFLIGLAALLDQHEPFLSFLIPLIMFQWLFLIIAGLVVWRQGFGPARFFLIAWGPYVAGGLLLNAVVLGLVPRNVVTFNALQIGHAVEVVLLSLALASRINILRQEKEQEAAAAQAATLRARDLELQAQSAENKLRERERDQARAALGRERRRRLQAREQTIESWTVDDFVGSSAAMQPVLAQVRALQQSETRVLISGEQGTGKELVARSIHAGSRRCEGAFVVLRCAELPTSLAALEVRTRVLSELLGHVAGAFAGAEADRDGVLQQANGGTLYLDEVGLLPLPLQSQLQRVLEQKQVRRTGASVAEALDVRVMAATSEDVQELEAAGFSRAFYEYLSETRIAVPPLRERREDVAPLARQIAREWAERAGQGPVELSDAVLARLRGFAFPGNVRQLQRLLTEALTERGGRTLRLDDVALDG